MTPGRGDSVDMVVQSIDGDQLTHRTERTDVSIEAGVHFYAIAVARAGRDVERLPEGATGGWVRASYDMADFDPGDGPWQLRPPCSVRDVPYVGPTEIGSVDTVGL